MPVLSERLAKDRQRRFELWLEKNGSDELLQRMQIVTLPQCAQNGTMKERLGYELCGEKQEIMCAIYKERVVNKMKKCDEELFSLKGQRNSNEMMKNNGKIFLDCCVPK